MIQKLTVIFLNPSVFLKLLSCRIPTQSNIDTDAEQYLRDQIKSLQDTIRENKNEMNDMRALLKETKLKLNDEIAKTNKLNSALNQNLSESNNNRDELKLLAEKNKDLQKFVNDVSESLSAVDGNTVLEKIGSYVTIKEELSEENRQLLQQLDELGKIVQEIEAERLKNTDIEADILTFERQLSQLSHLSANAATESNGKRPKFTDVIDELNTNLDKETDENNRLRSTVHELETKNHDLQEEIKLLSRKLNEQNRLHGELKESFERSKENARGI